jgi:hypothetical protein
MSDEGRKDEKDRGTKETASDRGATPSGGRLGRPRKSEVEPKQIIAVGMMMAGASQKAIARKLEVDEKTIGRWFREPEVKRELGAQLTAISAETWSKVALLAADVWGVFEALLNDPDPRIRLRASTWYLDRLLSVLPAKLLLEDGPVSLPQLPPSLHRFVEGSDDGKKASS